MIDRRPEPDKPNKKQKEEKPVNIAVIANTVAEAFVDCVMEGDIEDEQASLIEALSA